MKEKQGELQKVGLPALLHLIYLRKDDSAILDVIKEPIRKRFFFRNGIPVAASSNILNEVLGRLLMQEGVITQRQYEDSLEAVLKEKKRHGEVLISMGLLTAEALEDFLALQLKRRLFRLFDWEEGSFRYIKTELPVNIPSRPFHPASLVLEGISLGFYPVAKLKAALDDWLPKKARLSFEGSQYRLDDFHLNLQEKRFAESIDGTKTLQEALDSSDLLRHRAESIAASLVMTGVLKDELGARKAPEFLLEEAKDTHGPEVPVDSKLNAELLFMRARTAIAKREFSAAIPILRDITNINPAEGEYWAYLGWAIYNEDPSKIKDAESIIKDSIDLNNDLDSAWYFLGMTSLAQGNASWAQRALKTAIQKNPWNTEALAELKRLELRLIYRDAPHDVYSAFGFIEDPFAPVPKRVVLSEVQSAAIETLLRAVRKKTGPVFLKGASGTGKTTILLELLKRLSSDKVLASIVLKPASRELDFIREINKGLGVEASAPTVKEELLNLGMRVSQNRIQGGSTIIIVDEAHRLTNGCLKLIQYLSRLKAVQLLLSGEAALDERIKTTDFQELDGKLSARVELSDLSKEETAALLDAMLSKAGANGSSSFSIGIEEAEEIFETTGGNMGAIRREAANMLQKAYDDLQSIEAEAAKGPAPEELPGMDAFEAAPSLDIPPIEESAPEAQEAVPAWEEPKAETASDEAIKEEKAPAQEPSLPQAAPPKAVPAPAQAAHHKTETAPEPAPREEKAGQKRSVLRLVLLVVLMIVAGLLAGSLIGQYWFGQPRPPQETIVVPRQPALPSPPATEETDREAPLDTSLDMAPPDGSI